MNDLDENISNENSPALKHLLNPMYSPLAQKSFSHDGPTTLYVNLFSCENANRHTHTRKHNKRTINLCPVYLKAQL